jgi:hypothetical protein
VQWQRVEASAGATRTGTAQRGQQPVTQMRGRAAAIGRSVNRRHNWRSQEVGRTSPRQVVRRRRPSTVRLSTVRSVGWGTGSAHSRPSALSPAAVPRVRPSVRRPRETRRSTTDPAPCKLPSSATSWLRGHDSAPHWGSCGKPPSPLYVRNGGAVLSGYGGATRSGDSGRSQIAQRCQIHAVRSATVTEGVTSGPAGGSRVRAQRTVVRVMSAQPGRRRALAVPTDVTDPTGRCGCWSSGLAAYGRLDFAFNTVVGLSGLEPLTSALSARPRHIWNRA